MKSVSAQIIGSERCSAEGHTGRGSSPVLALCRKLVKAGLDPDLPLHAYRGDILCLTVRSIGEGARLTVKERQNGPALEIWRPFCSPRGSPRIAPTNRAATTLAQPPAALCLENLPHILDAPVSGSSPTVKTVSGINTEHPTEKLNTLNRHD